MVDLSEVDVAALSSVAASAVVGATVGVVRTVLPLGSARQESIFRIASLTKAVTAAATVRCAARANVPLDTPILEILPELAGDWAADPALTVAHALSQTSGLTSSVTAASIAALGDSDDACLQSARLVVSAGSTRRPGERWEYYNGNYFLVGAVLASLQHTSFEQAVADAVLDPWGMASTTFIPPPDLVAGVDDGAALTDSAYPRGRRPSGGMCSNTIDLLAFARHLLDDTELLKQVSAPRTATDDPMPYGFAWALGPAGQLYLNGRLSGYRAAIILLPAHDLGAVVLAADTDALPAVASVLSDLQRPLTGDDLSERIVSFAA